MVNDIFNPHFYQNNENHQNLQPDADNCMLVVGTQFGEVYAIHKNTDKIGWVYKGTSAIRAGIAIGWQQVKFSGKKGLIKGECWVAFTGECRLMTQNTIIGGMLFVNAGYGLFGEIPGNVLIAFELGK